MWNRANQGALSGTRGIQHPAIRPFYSKSSQNSRPVRARVDTDPVRLLVDAIADRMPMYDDEPMVALVIQERFPNPAQVCLALLFKRDSGTNPGVDKQIVAEPTGVGKAFEKIDMLPWNCSTNYGERFLVCCRCNLVWIDAIAKQAFGSTEPAPPRDELRISCEDAQQDFLVISEKKDGFHPAPVVGAKTLDHLSRIGTAVDEIAKKHQKALGGRLRIKLGMYLAKEILQKIKPAVDVTDDVGTAIRRSFRRPVRRSSGTEHRRPNEV